MLSLSIAELGGNTISRFNTFSNDQCRLQLALCLDTDLRTLEWAPGAALWSEAGDAAQHSLLCRIPALPQLVGWPVLVGSGGEKILVRAGASLWEGFWLPSQYYTEVMPTAARYQDGVWRRTRFPATGLLLAELLLLKPACRLSFMRVQKGLAGEVFGFAPSLTTEPGRVSRCL